MAKVVCGTDFSESAARAEAVAAALARRLGDTLELVSVIETPAAVIPELSIDGPRLMEGMREAAAGQLDRRAAALRATGVDANWKVLDGLAEETLLHQARQQGARLLALGTHGRRGGARLFLGSVSERVVRKASLPVLVVPSVDEATPIEQAHDRQTRPLPPLRIVAGVDASPSSDAALTWLRGLPTDIGLQLTLVHVYWPLRERARFGIDEGGIEGTEEIEALLERELRPRVNDALGAMPARLRFHPLIGSESDPLTREADLADADMLVVGTSQRHDRWGGSTAIGTVRASRRPVLCVPAVVARVAATAAPTRPLRSLLVAVDLGDASRAALAAAYRMLRGGGGVVELLHVVKPSSEGLASERGAAIEQELHNLTPGREQPGVLTRTTLLESDAPATAIVQAAERLGVDGIVVASHGRGGVRRALLGSVAEQVLRHSKRPVTVVPAEGSGDRL